MRLRLTHVVPPSIAARLALTVALPPFAVDVAVDLRPKALRLDVSQLRADARADGSLAVGAEVTVAPRDVAALRQAFGGGGARTIVDLRVSGAPTLEMLPPMVFAVPRGGAAAPSGDWKASAPLASALFELPSLKPLASNLLPPLRLVKPSAAGATLEAEIEGRSAAGVRLTLRKPTLSVLYSDGAAAKPVKVATIQLGDGDDLVLAPGAHLKLRPRISVHADGDCAQTNCFHAGEMYPSYLGKSPAEAKEEAPKEEVKEEEEKGDDDDDDGEAATSGGEEKESTLRQEVGSFLNDAGDSLGKIDTNKLLNRGQDYLDSFSIGRRLDGAGGEAPAPASWGDYCSPCALARFLGRRGRNAPYGGDARVQCCLRRRQTAQLPHAVRPQRRLEQPA